MKIINNRITIFLVCVALLISSCGAPVQQAEAPASDQEAEALERTVVQQPTDTTLPPTETPIPATDTPLPPTATFTLAPTATPAITFTPKVPLAEERYTVEGGGFSFQVPADYKVETRLYSASITGPGVGPVQIMLSGSPNEKNRSMDELSKGVLEPMPGMPALDVEIVEDVTVSIAGESGRMIKTKTNVGIPAATTTVVANPFEGKQAFSASMTVIDYSNILNREPLNEEDLALLQDTFGSILSSVQFQEIPASAHLQTLDPAVCLVSTDDTYGMNDENPIPLATYPGDTRVDEYFAMLRGPNGEELKYQLTGMSGGVSSEGNKFSLKYSVTSDGLAQPVVLYIWPIEPTAVDEIQQPQAPTGFTCAKP